MMNEKHSVEFGFNELVVHSGNVSRTTQWKYRKDMGLVQHIKSDVKAKARQKAFLNLRNPLSLCASLTVVSQEVDSELFFSSDDVSILVNGWDKPTVITTKEAQNILNEQNISISTTEDSAKRRVIVFNFTISKHGNLICSVIKLYDSNFVDFRKKPKVYKLEEKMYVMLCHPDISDGLIQLWMYKLCIIPDAISFRNNIIKRDIEGPEELMCSQSTESQPQVEEDHSNNNQSSSSSHPSASSSSSHPPVFIRKDPSIVKERFRKMALASDGALSQINALLDELKKSDNVIVREHIMLVKYAAACSMTESPNDHGKMHQILHLLFSSPQFRYDQNHNEDPRGEKWIHLQEILLKYLDAASFNSIWSCLQRAEAFISKAFNKMNVESAFKESGVYPFEARKILSRNPHFRKLGKDDADLVLYSIGPLSEMCKLHGYIPEEDFEAILGDIDNSPEKLTGMHLNDMHTSRQRSMIITNESYLRERGILPVLNTNSNDQDLQLNLNAERTNPGVGTNAEIEDATAGVVVTTDAQINGTKSPRKTRCSNVNCKSTREAKNHNWYKCKGLKKNCRVTFCNDPQCCEMAVNHNQICVK